ncbi:MAG: type II toxin-antitoxin system Phd/YefM family antitoxin [Acidobacteriaceae bacterium]
MKRKIQVRQHKTSKVRKPPHGTGDQRRLQLSEAVRKQSESARYIPASEAKNRFATVLDTVSKGQEVFITKHNAPKAVVISVERFMALSGAATSVLDRLTDEFDARLARMQTPAARIAMERAFHASTAELGKAALKAGRLHS